MNKRKTKKKQYRSNFFLVSVPPRSATALVCTRPLVRVLPLASTHLPPTSTTAVTLICVEPCMNMGFSVPGSTHYVTLPLMNH